MHKTGLCEKKFSSMLLSGTLTMAVMYIMLLSDSIVAGHFLGETGIAAINATAFSTGIMTFVASLASIGPGIIFSRMRGESDAKRADEIFGQGLIVSIFLGLCIALIFHLCRNAYFEALGISGRIYVLADEYYSLIPINSVVSVIVAYLNQMVYSDGDETINNISYSVQIVGNITISIISVIRIGMLGIIIGTIAGNVLGIAASLVHFFKKTNTLHFVWHFSVRDLLECSRYSAVDAMIYLCWGAMDFILTEYVVSHYDEASQTVLAVVMNLIEFSVITDGVGMAVQPLIQTYLGEKNHVLIRRLIRVAGCAALIEGAISAILTAVFARGFVAIFGVKHESVVGSAVNAVRLAAAGLLFCSILALVSAYYMYIDHVFLAVVITIIKDGVLYSTLPIIGSKIAGLNGMWIGVCISPVLALAVTLIYIYIRYGRERFPYIIELRNDNPLVYDDILSDKNCARLSEAVDKELTKRGYADHIVQRASTFVEESAISILEKNRGAKKQLFVEYSVFFEPESVFIIERDSGIPFDMSDPDMKIDGLGSMALSGFVGRHKSTIHLSAVGINRNMVHIS